jgi:hypothetical protein
LPSFITLVAKAFVIVVIISSYAVSSDSNPNWVNLGPDADKTCVYSVDVESIAKIKGKVYAVWSKKVPGGQALEKDWQLINGRRISYYMLLEYYDLSNHEVKPIELLAYYETGEPAYNRARRL